MEDIIYVGTVLRVRSGVVCMRVRVTESVAPAGVLRVGVSVERDGYAPSTVQVSVQVRRELSPYRPAGRCHRWRIQQPVAARRGSTAQGCL